VVDPLELELDKTGKCRFRTSSPLLRSSSLTHSRLTLRSTCPLSAKIATATVEDSST